MEGSEDHKNGSRPQIAMCLVKKVDSHVIKLNDYSSICLLAHQLSDPDVSKQMYGLIEVDLELSPRLEPLGDASQFIDAIFEAVDRIPIFGDFVYEEIKLLAGYMQCFGAPANEEIMTEGESGDYLLLILTGAVKVLKSEPGNYKNRKLIAMVGPGTTLGEMSLIDGERRFATCVTITPTDFALLRRSDLHRLINELPNISNRFLISLLQLMTRRLRETSIKLAPHASADIT